MRVLALGQSEQVGNAYNVGVGNDGRLAVDVAADKVGGLSAHSLKGGQVLDIIGYNSAEVIP